MAILKKDGGMSGIIGNIVFVNSDGRTIVRSKPTDVRQTDRTKAAASVFGTVSQREKLLRRELEREIGLPALQYFAARHRARLRKTVVVDADSIIAGKPNFGSPAALTGFDFNPKLEWGGCTNFYPIFAKNADNIVEVQLPEIRWLREVKPPRNAISATLSLHALSVNMNRERPEVIAFSDLLINFSERLNHAPQTWNLQNPKPGNWLLIIGMLRFKGNFRNFTECFSGCYLWAG